MSTPYSAIDNSFIGKISDDFLVNMSEEHLQKIINGYRKSAIIRFKQCKKLSERDEVVREFSQTLTDEEVEILANLMVLEWLRPQINSVEILKPNMTTKDYITYSNANHLGTLKALKQDVQSEVDRLIVSYSYSNNALSGLGGVNNG